MGKDHQDITEEIKDAKSAFKECDKVQRNKTGGKWRLNNRHKNILNNLMSIILKTQSKEQILRKYDQHY